MNGWKLERDVYSQEERQAMEPVYTLGNGYLCARGYFEEEQSGLLSYGGTYMAGIFGKARYVPWKGMGRELVNTANIFAIRLFADGEPVEFSEQNSRDFHIDFEMESPKLCRSYVWTGHSGTQIRVKFERFISGDDIHLAGQRLTIIPVNGCPQIKLDLYINPDILNLNLVSSEPLPQQPGVRHLQVASSDRDTVVTRISGYEEIEIAQGQQVSLEAHHEMELLAEEYGMCQTSYLIQGQRGKSYTVKKLIYTYTSKDVEEPLKAVRKCLEKHQDYEEAFARHAEAWKHKWENANIRIRGNEADQASLRYNLLQLMQSCPEHTSKQSIGARGLTGEMYEGCIFWDTEIFMLPFFTFTNPEAARKLLQFRYHTLPEARLHAQKNYFRGAMYGWQVSEKGIEQTPMGVGAYYSIHIVADIAYAIMEYWYATKDESFVLDAGAEILIETARFWESRVHKNPESGLYDLLAVRGPNEYDVIVNNNLYTNMMAQQNLLLAMDLIHMMEENYSQNWEVLRQRLKFEEREMESWKQIADNIVISYDAKRDLYEEDDRYFSRVPLDLKAMKTSLMRVIDTTLPYEALSLYQITKQADVLHVMKNLHWRFTDGQKRKAWEYYVPKTCFDSSLSYSMHAVMAAQFGMRDVAYRYYDVCSNFDVRNMQLNTVSGLHFANFGGTWQAVIFGFAGIRVDESGMTISPCIPAQWEEISFRMWYCNHQLQITIDNESVQVRLLTETGEKLPPLSINEKKFYLGKGNSYIRVCLKKGENLHV